MPLDEAIAYAERHTLHVLLVARAGTHLFERFGAGYTADTPHALYSGTKSFWGILAVAAQEDGLLALDEPVAQTLHEWNADERKRRITIAQLLQLTAGFAFGGLGNAVPTYESAIATPLRDEPGSTFTYGGIPLQVFGALLARKLAARSMDPHDYLAQRILTPLEIVVPSWRRLKDGTRPLPTGASLSAAAWLRYGEFLAQLGSYQGRRIIAADLVARCRQGTAANPHYGLGFWLGAAGAPSDLFYASGAAGQALYVLPGEGLTIVHFGKSNSFRHEIFLRRLLPHLLSEV